MLRPLRGHPWCRQYARGTGGILGDDMGLGKPLLPFRSYKQTHLAGSRAGQSSAAALMRPPCPPRRACRQDGAGNRVHRCGTGQDGRPRRCAPARAAGGLCVLGLSPLATAPYPFPAGCALGRNRGGVVLGVGRGGSALECRGGRMLESCGCSQRPAASWGLVPGLPCLADAPTAGTLLVLDAVGQPSALLTLVQRLVGRSFGAPPAAAAQDRASAR